MKSMEFESRENFLFFLENEKEKMYSIIWESIDRAHALGSNSAYILEVYLIEESSYIDMISTREEWQESLNLALKYYISEEKYEECSSIKKLIDKIKT